MFAMLSRSWFLVGVALVVSGCDDGDGLARRECDAAAKTMVDVLVDASPKVQALHRDEFATMEDLLAKACHEDRWSRAALDCFTNAGDEAAWRACEKRWTAEQRDGVLATFEEMSVQLDREKVARIARRMDRIKGNICLCTDAACADRELQHLEAYVSSLKFWAPDVGRDAYGARMMAYQDEIAECARDARMP